MSSKYLPYIDKHTLTKALETGYGEFYDVLAEPLHEELYRRQTFDFLDDLSKGQQLLLAYDYVRTQVGQGGFIQFIQNGYVSLLPSIIEELYMVGANDMAKVLDDVLKVYVLNREILDKPTTVEEFALLYEELKEFEVIDARYYELNEPTMKIMLDYAKEHLEEFVKVG